MSAFNIHGDWVVDDHCQNDCNSAIRIERMDSRGAKHAYVIRVPRKEGGEYVHDVVFQNGPLAEVGNNGLTIEVCLALAIDQLRRHQESKYATDHNDRALGHVREALRALHERTKERQARGVEGTHEV